MSVKLTKKQRKYYSALLAAKLNQLGIEDKIQFRGSGKKRKFYEKDAAGLIKTDNEGKPIVQEVEMPVASNTFRNTINTLRNGTLAEVEAFLSVPETK